MSALNDLHGNYIPLELYIIFYLDLGEFSPLPDADYNAQAFKGVRLECNTPSYYPGNTLLLQYTFISFF